MLAEMTSHEFGEWMAFYALEPFGPLRDDLRAGTIAATLVNLKRRSDSPAIHPADFFPELSEPEAPTKPLEGVSIQSAMAVTLAMGGKVIRRGEQ